MPRHIPRPHRKKKRRSKKLPEHLRKHSFKRAMTRYGLVFDEEKRQEVKEKIAAGIPREDCFCVERQSQTKTLWRVVIDDTVCGLVYNSRLSEIVTFIPADDPRIVKAGVEQSMAPAHQDLSESTRNRREHAILRARQRYGIIFNEEKRQEVIGKIKDPMLHPDCYCVGRLSKRRSYWRAIIDDTICCIIYDSRHSDIITFIKNFKLIDTI